MANTKRKKMKGEKYYGISSSVIIPHLSELERGNSNICAHRWKHEGRK